MDSLDQEFARLKPLWADKPKVAKDTTGKSQGVSLLVDANVVDDPVLLHQFERFGIKTTSAEARRRSYHELNEKLQLKELIKIGKELDDQITELEQGNGSPVLTAERPRTEQDEKDGRR